LGDLDDLTCGSPGSPGDEDAVTGDRSGISDWMR